MELKAATCVVQSFSNELNTVVSDSVKFKRTKVDTKWRYIPELTLVAETAKR